MKTTWEQDGGDIVVRTPANPEGLLKAMEVLVRLMGAQSLFPAESMVKRVEAGTPQLVK